MHNFHSAWICYLWVTSLFRPSGYTTIIKHSDYWDLPFAFHIPSHNPVWHLSLYIPSHFMFVQSTVTHVDPSANPSPSGFCSLLSSPRFSLLEVLVLKFFQLYITSNLLFLVLVKPKLSIYTWVGYRYNYFGF